VDIRDSASVARVFDEFRPDAVTHQAAQMSVSRSMREPAFDADVNLVGLLNVLEHAARVGVSRFVFASSGGALYGDVDLPAAEEAPLLPIAPYGMSKMFGEMYLQFFAKEHRMTTVALRYSNVYGPRQNPHGEAGVVAIFSQRMLRGEATTINGDGSIVRDYVYVADVAAANTAALVHPVLPSFSAFNVGTGVKTTVSQLADGILRACAAELQRRNRTTVILKPTHGPPRAGDLQSSVVAPTRAIGQLAWRPSWSLSEGLAATVKSFADDAFGAFGAA
jgi:UDP-glucose 4-epimerase